VSDYDSQPAGFRRIGNTDRDATVEHLAERVATGHLTQDEFTERRDQALTARTRRDLDNLTDDIPPLASQHLEPQKYKTQLMGYGYPFSMTRWLGSLILAASMIVLPGPIMSAEWGGFDHIPMHGLGAVLTIVGGVVLLIFGGLGFMPDGTEMKPGTPGGRNY